MEKVLLDCRGMPCPQPVMETRKLLERRPEAITVLVDNLPASENVRRMLEKSGYASGVETEQKESHLWAVHAFASCAAGTGAEAAEKGCGRPEKRTLVFLSSEYLGHGNDELGARLMQNFLSTLHEMDGLWRIVLVNGGVKLASLPGRSLEALKELEKNGVSILVCGTCLAFYELTDKKQAGETTNMLDIVTSFDVADKIIRP